MKIGFFNEYLPSCDLFFCVYSKGVEPFFNENSFFTGIYRLKIS